MVLVKILKRRDASSVVVAVLVAMILAQPISDVTTRLAAKISSLHNGQYVGYAYPGSGWKGEYLYPVIWAVLQLILLEILAWIYVLSVGSVKKK
jgi:hypothetical protein